MTTQKQIDAADQPALLACPFCGGDELSHGYSYPPDLGNVECHTCDLTIFADTEDKAIAAWNTRAPRVEGGEGVPTSDADHEGFKRRNAATALGLWLHWIDAPRQTKTDIAKFKELLRDVKSMLAAIPAGVPVPPLSLEAVAWLIEYKAPGSVPEEIKRVVHLHNAIGDYRPLDPEAKVTPLAAALTAPNPPVVTDASTNTLAARGMQLADEAMLIQLRSYGTRAVGAKFLLPKPRQVELHEAVEWLVARGLVELGSDAGGEFARVLPPVA